MNVVNVICEFCGLIVKWVFSNVLGVFDVDVLEVIGVVIVKVCFDDS